MTMKAIQCFTAPLADHASHFQSIASRSLQELPRMLGKSPNVGSSGDFYFGTVSGEYNFDFSFRLEGGGLFQTGVLVASAMSRPQASGSGGPVALPIPLKCTWKRRVGDYLVEIPGISSNMYQISADDIGTNVYVEAQPADGDEGYHGIAHGEIGPFELDPSTRRSLDNAIGAGGSRFPVRYFQCEKDEKAQDLVIHVMQDDVKVVQPGIAERFNKEVSANYTADYPKVIIHPLDTVKFQFLVSTDRTFHLAALSRTSRDLIALTIRCFHARKYISTSFVLNKLFQNPATPGAPPTGTQSEGKLDLCILMERLTKELNRALASKDRIEKMLLNAQSEKRRLDEQLHETITSYTSVIDHLQQQVQIGGVGHDRSAQVQIQQRLQQTEIQCSQLCQETDELRRALAEERAQRATSPYDDGPECTRGGHVEELTRLADENSRLHARCDELTRMAAGDQSLTMDLKRMRQDLDRLSSEKDRLQQQVLQSDHDKRELTENFMYVKGELDKMQIRQTMHGCATEGGYSSSSSVGGNADETILLRGQIQQLTEERNRLNIRIEALCRDLEKGKTQSESSLERVMTSNARLLEEKDRLEKEVKRNSVLYQDVARQLSAHQQQIAVTISQHQGVGPAQVNVQAKEQFAKQLQLQLVQKEELINTWDAENQSLKSRIRKLAVAS